MGTAANPTAEAAWPVRQPEPWADLLAQGAAVRQDLLRAAGGALSTGEVASMLGITRQAVHQRARRGKLFALSGGSEERLYPACQFADGRVLEGLADVLAAARFEDPWTTLSVLLDTDDAVGCQRLIDALRAGEVEPVVRAVRSFGA